MAMFVSAGPESTYSCGLTRERPWPAGEEEGVEKESGYGLQINPGPRGSGP